MIKLYLNTIFFCVVILTGKISSSCEDYSKSQILSQDFRIDWKPIVSPVLYARLTINALSGTFAFGVLSDANTTSSVGFLGTLENGRVKTMFYVVGIDSYNVLTLETSIWIRVNDSRNGSASLIEFSVHICDSTNNSLIIPPAPKVFSYYTNQTTQFKPNTLVNITGLEIKFATIQDIVDIVDKGSCPRQKNTAGIIQTSIFLVISMFFILMNS